MDCSLPEEELWLLARMGSQKSASALRSRDRGRRHDLLNRSFPKAEEGDRAKVQ